MNPVYISNRFRATSSRPIDELDNSVVIIDDFVSNSRRIRGELDQGDFKVKITASGFRYNYSEPSKRTILRSLDEMDRITGFNLASFSCMSAFVFETEADERFTRSKTWIHFDAWKYVAIHYLNRPFECAGGTNFYSHQATGINKFTERDIRDKPILGKTFREDSTMDDRWTCELRVRMQWNRLIIFNPSYFHSPAFYFGVDLATARKYQVFAFT